ncbi:hypothetical protein ABB37_08486 [Leptomonas pyrrhocoris]|uniref:Uncharacterized protein n=1 Tax=Leptomonas pyrrhocoris TaxID=157538 RepID=A0A0N0DS56_LEPPY|nr:hypothetical protein ABB37_08486 [Leptomonas pyrrhocoris]XP_015654057.1 hypothetical protein ABB37_08486 [Leptomonas pyrrhocoris]KPA75617.1 hypothetical protein ABB37_08486 [Leptomonas pyrrhocoris]KPA75618.1 hypothetical protein ABB37_08486 [Leptomonas pyrrhocoris]|eukprot:XP_015654056.1 hypothetical protein ABB37_08486 [Leptomonas pyrrhocoris]
MSAQPKPTAATPPVVARRRPKPQYLAPGQHLKVASRKPPTQEVPPEQGIPRDPWESQDAAAHPLHTHDDDDDVCGTPRPPSAPLSGSMTGGGSRSPLGRRSSAGGHPFSSHLRRSRSNANSESTPSKEVSSNSVMSENAPGLPAKTASVTPPAAPEAEEPVEEKEKGNGVDAADKAAKTEEDQEEEEYYHTAPKGPELTAAERAQRVLEMQQQALEAKQLQKLTEQGIARRPKTLVRNRHGRLQAIAAPSSATTTEETLCIDDAPVVMEAKAKARRGVRDTTQSKATMPAPTPTVTTTASGGDDLVNSRSSTPITRDEPAKLEIDLD